MNIYFIFLCVLMALNLGIAMAKDGDSREDERYSFIVTLIASVIQFVTVYMAIETGF